jgi:hypothetical protein
VPTPLPAVAGVVKLALMLSLFCNPVSVPVSTGSVAP